jgi:hypothetical protein
MLLQTATAAVMGVIGVMGVVEAGMAEHLNA